MLQSRRFAGERSSSLEKENSVVDFGGYVFLFFVVRNDCFKTALHGRVVNIVLKQLLARSGHEFLRLYPLQIQFL